MDLICLQKCMEIYPTWRRKDLSYLIIMIIIIIKRRGVVRKVCLSEGILTLMAVMGKPLPFIESWVSSAGSLLRVHLHHLSQTFPNLNTVTLPHPQHWPIVVCGWYKTDLVFNFLIQKFYNEQTINQLIFLKYKIFCADLFSGAFLAPSGALIVTVVNYK